MNGLGLRLASALAALLLASCASYYRVEVSGDRAEQIRSVFLIVAETDPFDGVEGDAASLIDPEKVGDYLLFAQFDPEAGNPLTWREESADAKSTLLLRELSGDRRTVLLYVDRQLLEGYAGLTIVAVGHGSDGWYSEVVDSGKIRFEKGMELQVGSQKFVRRPIQ